MSDRARLERALRAAHAAGDTAAAQRIAQEILATQQTPEQAPSASDVPRPAMALGQVEGDIPVIIGTAETGAPITADWERPEGFVPPAKGSFQARDASIGQQIQLAAGYFLNSSPDARKDMIRNILGDEATFEVDERGNTIVKYGNERANISQPGIDAQDAIDFMSDMVKFLPAAKVASFFGGPAMAIFGRGPSAIRGAVAGAPAAMVTQAASDIASEAFGSEQGVNLPAMAAAGIGGAGGELAGGMIRRFTPRADEVLSRISDLGIDPVASPGRQVRQVAETARGMSSPERGAAMPDVAAAVSREREAARSAAGEMFDVARSQRASVPAIEVARLNSKVADSVSTFILGADGMSAVRRQFETLNQLADLDVPFPRKLQALEQWRARVTSMTPRDGSPAQAAASRMKNAYDDWLDDAFNRDMIQGTPEAVNAWKDARGAWAAYKQRFDSNRVIRDLAQKETSQEQMAQWLFNSNAVGAKKEAGIVVQRLNDILGTDSKQMAGLRSEVVLDIAAPLFDNTPNIQGFISNYERWFGNNPTLRSSLFPGDKADDLVDLYRFAKSIASRPGATVADMQGTDIGGRAIKFINRLYLGHGIAQGAARIESGNIVANWIRQQSSGRSARIDMLRDYLGMEPTQSMLPAPAATGASIMRLQQREGEQ
jgi:hypothetical protein